MSWVTEFMFFLAQMGDRPSGDVDDAGGAGGGNGGDGSFFGDGFFTFMLLMSIVLVVYILLMNRPHQKDQARTRDMLANLKKNDRVLTAGGILGTVVNLRDDNEYVTLRVDEATKTKMQVLKSSIVRVVTDEDDKKGSS